jgi:threonine aldolase
MAGEAFDFDEMRRICEFARERGIGLHLDGARLLIEAVYTRMAPADYAALFDTVYISLYKYLNAAAGAVLAGPRALLEGLYHQRRMFGGGLPHVWPYAAVALHFLDGFSERFAKAVAASKVLLDALRDHPRVIVIRPPQCHVAAGERRFSKGPPPSPARARHRDPPGAARSPGWRGICAPHQ